VIGWLLGIEDRYNPCSAGVNEAKAHIESMVMHLLHPDSTSIMMAHHLLKAPEGAHSGDSTEKGFHRQAALCRAMLGDQLADALELPVSAKAATSTQRLLWIMRWYDKLCSLPLGRKFSVWSHRQLLKFVGYTRKKAPGSNKFGMKAVPKCPLGFTFDQSQTDANVPQTEDTAQQRTYSFVSRLPWFAASISLAGVVLWWHSDRTMVK